VTWSFLLDAMPKKDNSEDLDHLCADFTPAWSCKSRRVGSRPAHSHSHTWLLCSASWMKQQTGPQPLWSLHWNRKSSLILNSGLTTKVSGFVQVNITPTHPKVGNVCVLEERQLMALGVWPACSLFSMTITVSLTNFFLCPSQGRHRRRTRR
jgi:hypothetical protein